MAFFSFMTFRVLKRRSQIFQRMIFAKWLQSGPTSLSLCINIKWHFLSKKKEKTISIPFYSFSLLPLSLSFFSSPFLFLFEECHFLFMGYFFLLVQWIMNHCQQYSFACSICPKFCQQERLSCSFIFAF